MKFWLSQYRNSPKGWKYKITVLKYRKSNLWAWTLHQRNGTPMAARWGFASHFNCVRSLERTLNAMAGRGFLVVDEKKR